MALANSLALKLAGVTSLLEDPNGGAIMRTPAGGNMLILPTWLLYLVIF